MNDAGIWSNTRMSAQLENKTLGIPQTRKLHKTDVSLPLAMVGDEGFPLKTYLMRPFARRKLVGARERVFNYRLSRARRVIENAFGILVSRWRILQKPMSFKIENCEAVVKALVCLHNFIISTGKRRGGYNRYVDTIDMEDDGADNGCLRDIGRAGANVGAAAAARQRETLADYFVSENGERPWQNSHI